VPDSDRVGADRHDGWKGQGRACLQAEAAGMPWTFDLPVLDRALGQRGLSVRTGVIDHVDRVFEANDGKGWVPFDLDANRTPLLQLRFLAELQSIGFHATRRIGHSATGWSEPCDPGPAGEPSPRSSGVVPQSRTRTRAMAWPACGGASHAPTRPRRSSRRASRPGIPR